LRRGWVGGLGREGGGVMGGGRPARKGDEEGPV